MNWRMFLSFLFVLAVVAFLLGFWNFANGVRKPVPAETPRADAIVALTGGSERLQTGVRLLKEHRGERLLISGVNREVSDKELLNDVLHIDARTAQCCVDLGRSAEDTLGNASETAAWARARHYRRLILVTDDYHMPRSLTELSIAMPDADIYPYPVRTRYTDPALWRGDLAAASRLGSEYVKYLMIRGREALIDMSTKKKPAGASAS